MEPVEYEIFKANTKTIAAEVVLNWMAGILQLVATRLPVAEREQLAIQGLAKLEKARADYLTMTFPEMDAAHSDLMAAELQDAFDQYSKALRALLQQL